MTWWNGIRGQARNARIIIGGRRRTGASSRRADVETIGVVHFDLKKVTRGRVLDEDDTPGIMILCIRDHAFKELFTLAMLSRTSGQSNGRHGQGREGRLDRHWL